ncbi:hypothetical protein CcaverHIS002_0104930 [Cutaneotrichosporon cavernicola]|nr:hypothetical protein CcaverHIS002_0104930 [Cutaneotrichosporon cavernicola]
MTTVADTRRPSGTDQPPPHRRKTSFCAASAHNLMSDSISNLDLSPTTSTLSGVSVYEWKLTKAPWAGDAPLASFRLIEFILFSLSKEGWSLALAAGIPAKHGARDTFFFRPAERRQRHFFSIIFGTHMVTLLDAIDPRVCEEFVQACETWPGGAGALYSREHGAFAVNMKPVGDGDTAWPTGGKYQHAMSQLMCAVLQRMALAGYECVTTYDVLDRSTSWYWNDAKGIVTGSMPSIDIWVFAER